MTTKLNDLFKDANSVLKTNAKQGTSIYKSELFEGLNNSEKKSLRIKLRRMKDKFIQSYVMNKTNKEYLKELQKTWLKYAKDIYNDVSIIVDNNSTQQNKDDASNFITAMLVDYSKKDDTTKQNKTTKQTKK